MDRKLCSITSRQIVNTVICSTPLKIYIMQQEQSYLNYLNKLRLDLLFRRFVELDYYSQVGQYEENLHIMFSLTVGYILVRVGQSTRPAGAAMNSNRGQGSGESRQLADSIAGNVPLMVRAKSTIPGGTLLTNKPFHPLTYLVRFVL